MNINIVYFSSINVRYVNFRRISPKTPIIGDYLFTYKLLKTSTFGIYRDALNNS